MNLTLQYSSICPSLLRATSLIWLLPKIIFPEIQHDLYLNTFCINNLMKISDDIETVKKRHTIIKPWAKILCTS